MTTLSINDGSRALQRQCASEARTVRVDVPITCLDAFVKRVRPEFDVYMRNGGYRLRMRNLRPTIMGWAFDPEVDGGMS